MKPIKLNDLKKTAKVLNELLFEEPLINVKGDENVLSTEILEAAEELTEDEFEELDEVIQDTITALRENKVENEKAEEDTDDDLPPAEQTKKTPNTPVKETKATAPAEDDDEVEEVDEEEGLNEQVENADLAELKALVKTEEVFKPLRQSLGIQKDAEKLRAKMLDLLELPDEEDEPEVKQAPAKKAAPAPAPVKETKKADKAGKKGVEKVGIIDTIVKCLETASKKDGVSREEILKVLESQFPDRNPESMKKTIQVQVPGRINVEKFAIKKIGENRFAKA